MHKKTWLDHFCVTYKNRTELTALTLCLFEIPLRKEINQTEVLENIFVIFLSKLNYTVFPFIIYQNISHSFENSFQHNRTGMTFAWNVLEDILDT